MRIANGAAEGGPWSGRRVALVHDWLTGMRGGERVLEALVGIFPEAEIFTLVHVPGAVSGIIEARPIHVAWPGRLPGADRWFRYALPALPRVAEGLDLEGFDLVVSVSSCVAKGVLAPPGVPHLCYCNTPMRYAWDLFDDYFGPGRASAPVRLAMRVVAPRLRTWDRASSQRVTRFLANSEHVKERIHRHYGREAHVVYPPVDVARFAPAPVKGDEYLCLGALVPYKRVDLVVDAFTALGRPLRVVGDGPERARLEARAGPSVRFTGWLSDGEVAELLGRSRALVHAGIEDFGITLVEAQAAGTPVVAFAEGGAAETVVDAGSPPAERGPPSADDSAHPAQRGAPTGLLFGRQTPDDLAEAILRFERLDFDPAALRANAERFAPARFEAGVRRELEGLHAGDGQGDASRSTGAEA